MEHIQRMAVIGGGSWATALVKILSNNLEQLNWYVRTEEAINYIKEFKRNPKYLQAVELKTENLIISNDLSSIIDNSDLIIVATPSAFIVSLFENIRPEQLKDKIIFSAVKGIIPEYLSIPARYFHKSFDVPYNKIGIICGPCHAEEVALEKLSYLTVACQSDTIADIMAQTLACRYIKTTASDDLFGTELSAVLKNVYAIASGICAGLGYGDNFHAVLMSNAIQEIEDFIDEVSPIHRDVKSSAYLGDLLVTSYSKFSRNRTFGFMIGKGYSVKTAQMEMEMIAEGYYAVKSIMQINKKFEVNLPIVNAVYNVLYEKISPVVEMRILSDTLS